MKSEFEFIEIESKKLSKYAEEWIGVGKEIVTHGKDGELVSKQVRAKYSNKTPLIMTVLKSSVMLL